MLETVDTIDAVKNYFTSQHRSLNLATRKIHPFLTKTKYGNLYLRLSEYPISKWKINPLKQWLVQSRSHCSKIILQENPNVQLSLTLNKSMFNYQTVLETIKLEQWPVQSGKPVHHRYARKTTPVTHALLAWNKSVSG